MKTFVFIAIPLFRYVILFSYVNFKVFKLNET